jgi:hypothetical protein
MVTDGGLGQAWIATVYAKLLDQGIYLGSVSTMYRILPEHDQVREHRRQATHPAHKKPQLIFTQEHVGQHRPLPWLSGFHNDARDRGVHFGSDGVTGWVPRLR